MRSKCDVLILIWGMIGRDAEALIPIIYLLKKKYKLKVIVRSIFDYTAIDCLRPKVLLTNGCNGSSETYKATKYAKSRGIHTVSLHAEGIFRKESIESFIIADNKSGQPTVNKWFVWGENNYEMAIKYYPQFKEVLRVAASTLHEKYIIHKNNNFLRSNFLKKKYSQIALYTAGSFDYYGPGVLGDYGAKQKEYIIDYLRYLAATYPECLLVLKYHPATINISKTEIYNYFDDLENILILRDEYPIYKLILSCDIMLNFDSTTQIDAWLAGKPTISLFRNDCSPYGDKEEGNDFIRNGALNPLTFNDFKSSIDEFFKKGSIIEFEEKSTIRNEIILKSIGDVFSKPSLTIASYISFNLKGHKRNLSQFSFLYFLKGILNKLFYHFQFLPNIKGVSNMREHFDPEGFKSQYDEFKPYLRKYYNL